MRIARREGLRLVRAFLASLLAFATVADAATYVVDDTGSLPYQSTLNSRWRQASGNRQVGTDIEGAATVTIHLNLAPWINRNARIYLALPQQSIGVVNVEWATQGRLLPGKLRRASPRSYRRRASRSPSSPARRPGR